MLRHIRHSVLLCTCLLSSILAGAATSAAQAPASAATPARLIGTVTATSAETLTLKLEAGTEVMVQLSPDTKLVRTAPGQKTLSGATVIRVSDLTAGDRVLVRATPGSDATHYTASAVIAMKQSDIAQAHAGQSEDWQKRGVAGVVKSVPADSASSTGSGGPAILLAGASPEATVTIRVIPTTVFRRYAPDSVSFADAKPSSLSAIHPGDQLRARGDRGPDGISAEEIVSGSFRNIAGTVVSTDVAHNVLTLSDLATKKPVTLRLTPETQMRKLPPMMAQMLAARNGAQSGAAGPKGAAAAAPGASPPPNFRPSDSPEAGADASSPGGAGRAHRDPSAMLQHAPLVSLADLKKGDALMVVASQPVDGTPATAITLIAGVEPLLESPSGAGSQNLFSASWNLSGSTAEAGPQ